MSAPTIERIGNYRILRLLGEGGMGAVYEAVQEPIERKVAVKVLHAKYAQEPTIISRFLNEARAVNLIDHPGIVQISDYGQQPGGAAYLVMEFLRGETLSARIKRPGSIQLVDVVRMARQIAAALTAAHDKNVFHRDLKPDNVMIIPDPDAEVPGRERVKLLDFGIAKVANAQEGPDGKPPKTSTDVVMGTPRYMAPEQCRGGVPVDGKADVYALGVMLFEMLSGRPPFVGASGEVLAMHIYEPAPLLRTLAPQVPVDLANLVQRLLAKKAPERPTMREVQGELEAMSVRNPTAVLQAIQLSSALAAAGATPSGSNPVMTPPGTPSQPSTLGFSTGQSVALGGQPRRKTPIFIGAGLLLTAVVGIGIFVLRAPAPPPPKPVEPVTNQTTTKPVPRMVRWSVDTTPPGAEVVRESDQKVLGNTPWKSEQPAEEGQLTVKLRLNGYVEKPLQFSKNSDENINETLQAKPAALVKKLPGRPGVPPLVGPRPGGTQPGVRPGGPQTGVRPSGPQTGVRPSGPQTGVRPGQGGNKKPPGDEQPRIVD